MLLPALVVRLLGTPNAPRQIYETFVARSTLPPGRYLILSGAYLHIVTNALTEPDYYPKVGKCLGFPRVVGSARATSGSAFPVVILRIVCNSCSMDALALFQNLAGLAQPAGLF
jgi:hypothetical protein